VSPSPWLVVGLGNPGPDYAGNRHNVGAMVVSALAGSLGARLTKHKARAEVAQLRLPPVGGQPGPGLVVAVPHTYMNLSGGPVSALAQYFGVETDQMLVVHDELDIPFGELRLKKGGGEGGHNGLRSVSQSLGTKEYCRLRLGIGRPPGRMDAADFVLRDFASAERAGAALMVAEGVEAVLDVVRLGWERAQLEVNTRAGA
jgi:peptidyl-tRNA hydrolase, PTH1 family